MFAGVFMLAAAVVGVRWWSHPGVFYPVGDTVDQTGVMRVHESMNIGMSYVHEDVRSDPVALSSARPDVLVNTAKATITLWVCTIDPSRRIGAIASVEGDLRQWCSRLVPSDGATLRLVDIPDQLVMTVVPTRLGRVIVKGVDLAYTHGWQHGTETIGEYIRLRAR